MILVIIVFGIAMFVLGAWLDSESRGGSAGESVGIAFEILFGLIAAAAILISIFLTFSAAGASTIEERIVMYEEENAKIEQQIDILVKDYQKYESGVFADVAADSAITLVSMYPELKSDQLVSSQLDIYVENNEMIKSLKLEQINVDVVRWWLYFGGRK